MKQKYFILLISLISAVATIAQDTTLTNEYFKLIKTYNTLDEVYLAHPELKPSPPKIVINDDEVLFYGDSREVVNRMPVVKEEEIPGDDPNYGIYPDYIKIHRNCGIIDGELLVVWESYGYWDANHIIPKSARVYNKKGVFITSIKPAHHVVVAPDKRHFVTYYTGEGRGDTVFVYRISGNLICEISNVSNSINIDFIERNLIKIHDHEQFKMKYFNFSCESDYNLNYLKELGINSVSNTFYSPSVGQVLVSTSRSGIFLLNISNELLWRKKIELIEKCIFLENSNTLFVQTRESYSINKPIKRSIIILDCTNGSTLYGDELDSLLEFNNSYIIVKKGGNYYEYTIL